VRTRGLAPLLLAMLLSVAGAAVPAQGLESPVGRWKTIDDRTGRPRSVVRIVEEGGRLTGRIESGFDPAERDRTCTLCTDERRGQRLQGMVILRDLRADSDEWSGGDILDPDNGTVYRCKLRLEEGGRKLVVRGYVGVSLFGRSQTWERMP
jgi:uncharacterized protein (DUF2147 family)